MQQKEAELNMIKTDVSVKFNYNTADILSAVTERLPITRDEIRDVVILKRSLNISDKSDIHYDLTVGISASEEREAGLLKMKKKVQPCEDLSLELPSCRFNDRVIVVGAGPAGLFCALTLAEAGARPILLERGLDVDGRIERVEIFGRLGVLDPECNVQFGEGGAGSFSDGKLKVGRLDKYKRKILCDLIDAGAPEDILYSVGAHVGTDKLRNILKKIRQKLISLGADIYFSTRLTDITVKDGRVVGCVAERGNEKLSFSSGEIVLATGHSARDVFELLRGKGALLEAKGFGIGLRIEHPREYIDRLVYGDQLPTGIGATSYHLVTHLPNGRSVYSFCMCPGGSVVAAASEPGGIVTNGMSEYARNADNSNAAFLVSVTPSDFDSDDPLAGIELQRKIEQRAFLSAGADYRAPATSLGAFTSFGAASLASVVPSYERGVSLISPEEYLPEYITDSLRSSITDFDDWMPGFNYPDAAMTGPETRTTSPVRVVRDGRLEAVGICGLYPAGEGAGYAGGIISSARDGVLIAERIIENHKI